MPQMIDDLYVDGAMYFKENKSNTTYQFIHRTTPRDFETVTIVITSTASSSAGTTLGRFSFLTPGVSADGPSTSIWAWASNLASNGHTDPGTAYPAFGVYNGSIILGMYSVSGSANITLVTARLSAPSGGGALSSYIYPADLPTTGVSYSITSQRNIRLDYAVITDKF